MRSMRSGTELMFHVATEKVMRASEWQVHTTFQAMGASARGTSPLATADPQAFVDVEQRRVRLRGQIEIEQGDHCLEALRVDHGPLPQGEGRSVENERKMRCAAKRRSVLDLD